MAKSGQVSLTQLACGELLEALRVCNFGGFKNALSERLCVIATRVSEELHSFVRLRLEIGRAHV